VKNPDLAANVVITITGPAPGVRLTVSWFVRPVPASRSGVPNVARALLGAWMMTIFAKIASKNQNQNRNPNPLPLNPKGVCSHEDH
jgi:hypothetical protein